MSGYDAEGAAFAATSASEGGTVAEGGRGLCSSSTCASSAKEMKSQDDEFWSVKFETLVNINYHKFRESSLSFFNKTIMAINVIFGSASVGVYLFASDGAVYFSALIAAVSAVDLVFDLAGKARDHRDFAREYIELYSDILTDESCNASQARKRLLKIASQAPDSYNAQRAKAHNSAVASLYREPSRYLIKIPLHHRIFGSICKFSSYTYV